MSVEGGHQRGSSLFTLLPLPFLEQILPNNKILLAAKLFSDKGLLASFIHSFIHHAFLLSDLTLVLKGNLHNVRAKVTWSQLDLVSSG